MKIILISWPFLATIFVADSKTKREKRMLWQRRVAGKGKEQRMAVDEER